MPATRTSPAKRLETSVIPKLKNMITKTKFIAHPLFLAAVLLGLAQTPSPAVDLFNGKDLAGCRSPAGAWLTFDITVRAPRFDSDGKKTQNAKMVKVIHNGTLIHENVELTGPTRSALSEKEKPAGPIMLQGNHGPVAFRNLRIEAI